MSTPLADALERLAFDRLTEANRTEADLAMSEEARWVAMYPPVDVPVLKGLRQRVRAFGSQPAALQAWLSGDLGAAIGVALDRGPVREPAVLDPLVLMTLRGRLYLRTTLVAPDTGAIELALGLAEVAIRAARDVFTAYGPPAEPRLSEAQATAWQLDTGASPGWDDARR
jgi:hypothetical protein